MNKQQQKDYDELEKEAQYWYDVIRRETETYHVMARNLQAASDDKARAGYLVAMEACSSSIEHAQKELIRIRTKLTAFL